MGRVNRHHLFIVSLNSRSSDIRWIYKWLVQNKQNHVLFHAARIKAKHCLRKGFVKASLHRLKDKLEKFMEEKAIGSQNTQCLRTPQVANNQSVATLGRSITTDLHCFYNFSLGILFYPSSWSGPAQLFWCSLFINWPLWIFI